jgi:hypothetical protein
MHTVFVSHAAADKLFVERELIPFLNSHALRTWYCKEEITTESHWAKSVRNGLQSCDWFMVVVSSHSATSQWVRREVGWAVGNRHSRIVPLRIDESTAHTLDPSLRLVKSIEWRSSPGAAKEKLLAIFESEEPGYRAVQTDPSEDLKFDDYVFSRPKNWHCIFCGWTCNDKCNDYICRQCDKIRPFAGGSATMIKCRRCDGFSLGIASYCEWCGEAIRS